MKAEGELKQQAEREAKIREAWNAICPMEFRTTDEGGYTDAVRLAAEQPKLHSILQWQFGRRGLVLLGDTGACKTRVVWRLLRREFDAGRRFTAIKAARFGMDAVANQMHSAEGFRAWMDALVNVPILFVDDFGKGKLTDNAEALWFGLVDERTEKGKPLIITCNSDGNQLKERMSEDRGEPMIRRLRDYCEAITLTKGKAK